MALMMSFQRAASSSGRSRLQTASEGTVMMMLSNSISAQGEGAARSRDQSAAEVTPAGEELGFSFHLVKPASMRTSMLHPPDL